MSVRVESPPIRGTFSARIVIAIIVALSIGIFAGTVITKAVDDRPAAVASPVGAQLWDAQKLQAMQGRAMAEQFRSEQPLAWDAQKLEAMEGRALAEQFRGEQAPVLWDEGKLEAMAGRVLAAGVGAEDPPVKPHLPKRPPRG
jgi:hypothetical protein